MQRQIPQFRGQIIFDNLFVAHPAIPAAELLTPVKPHEHPLPTCFVCGPARAKGDGLRIFAGPLGRTLLRHGSTIVLIDANAPIPGLVGFFARGRMPRYFKGPQQPRLGDLAYTEYAVLGV